MYRFGSHAVDHAHNETVKLPSPGFRSGELVTKITALLPLNVYAELDLLNLSLDRVEPETFPEWLLPLSSTAFPLNG